MTQDPILSVRGLQIRFGLRGRTLHAIREIDLDLYRGVGFGGLSGVGNGGVARLCSGVLIGIGGLGLSGGSGCCA